MTELALKYPPPISCYYYFCENIEGGFRYVYLHDLGNNQIGFKTIFVTFNQEGPVFYFEKLPKKLSPNWPNIKKELLDRTRN